MLNRSNRKGGEVKRLTKLTLEAQLSGYFQITVQKLHLNVFNLILISFGLFMTETK